MCNKSWSLYKYVPYKENQENKILEKVNTYLSIWYGWVSKN